MFKRYYNTHEFGIKIPAEFLGFSSFNCRHWRRETGTVKKVHDRRTLKICGTDEKEKTENITRRGTFV